MSSRLASLVVTNVSPVTTTVDIVDDAADGDSDDTVLGVSLAPGESYVVRMADGAVNDDAGGKWDGDFFRVRSTHPVMVMMGTASSWQHDWVPSEGKGSRGTGFFVFTLPTSGSRGDLNVFAYEDDTLVTVTDVSTNSITRTGKATTNLAGGSVVLRTRLNQGEDLNVRKNGLGLDTLLDGRTYWVKASKPVTVQSGHLGAISGGNQARDGGGFVPSANGSAAGSLFYTTIPHELGLPQEKELRVVCPNAGATVALYGANTASTGWSLISSTTSVAEGQHFDFVGASNTSFRNNELYKLTVTPPYLGCTVYEANWMETGSYGTSDSASVVSSDEGSGLGYAFSTYLGPPGLTKTVPPVGEQYNTYLAPNSYASHLYIYASKAGTSVSVKDLDTNGSIVNASFAVPEDGYFHFVVSRAQYDALRVGGLRPYLRVTASQPVTVVDGNFNDNWLTYFQSVAPPDPVAKVTTNTSVLSCGGHTTVTASCSNTGASTLNTLAATLQLPVGIIATAGSYSVSPSSVGASHVAWSSPSLVGGSSFDVTFDVSYDCTAVGCSPPDLSALRLECSGSSLAETRASVASASVALKDTRKPTLVSFSAVDVPDYTGNPARPRTRVEYMLSGGSASAITSLQRVLNDSSPSAAAATLDSATGVTARAFDDSYTLNYEAARYYRLKVQDGACTQTFGPVVVRTSSGQSGGVDGGLESNGRLASQLARRALSRPREYSWSALAVSDAEASNPLTSSLNEFTTPLFRSPATPAVQRATQQLLPQEGPDGSVPREATPTDLPGLTNAVDVAALDYLDAAGRAVATALVVETQGELYEHSKVLCDRAGGSTIDLICREPTQSKGDFIRTAFRNDKKSVGESAIEFKMYRADDGSYKAYSAWLQSDYPAPQRSQTVFNVQVWSRRPGYELILAQNVLDQVGARLEGEAQGPSGYFSDIRTLGGSLDGNVHSEQGQNLSLRTTRLLEDGQMHTETSALSAGPFRISSKPFMDATLELVDSKNKVVDRVWVSDGAWTAIDDAMAGGHTKVTSLETSKCQKREVATRSGDLSLSGCATLTADVADYAGVARHLGGGLAPVDLHGYAAVEFTLAADAPVRVCLEQPVATPEGQPCVELAAQPTATRMSVPLVSFLGANTCAPVAAESLATVSFVTRTAGPTRIDVRELAFTTRASAASPPLVSCLGAAPARELAPAAPEGSAPTHGQGASSVDSANSGCSVGRQKTDWLGGVALWVLAGVAALRRRRP
jgi:MYXO-CTERM domain-containing protein